jgi:predicted NAD/FAD-dependent oxidoreductase
MKKHIAIIGAGMAGITAARTLLQAGHDVQVFEATPQVGGRMGSLPTPYGTFDHGAQYFTVRDERLSLALQTVPGTQALCRAWSANAVRVLDPHGHVLEAARNTHEAHFVASPAMSQLLTHWAAPLGPRVHVNAPIERLERVGSHWRLHAKDMAASLPEFDAVLVATPHAAAMQVLRLSASHLAQTPLLTQPGQIEVAPCWSVMLAFPQASQPGLAHLGPQWNAARSTHHRIAWLCRESSKPARGSIERWLLQASPEWSLEHLHDDPHRVQAKLLRAFSELTGIHATPSFVKAYRWQEAKTLKALGKSYQWDATHQVGTCGDWHLGHRVEDAFVSGLELALHLHSHAART